MDKKEAEPKKGHPVFVYVLACFATTGGLLFGYDTGIVSGSMLLIETKENFDLSTVWKEAIVSATIGAAALSALIAGFLTDFLGRKKTIMIASVVFVIGAIVMGAAPDKYVLLVGRIVVGIGIGFASMTVPVYVAEAAPSDIRGRLVTLNQLFITIGIVISSLIAGAFSEMKTTGWRYMLGLAGIPGVVQFIGFIFMPESPRWLVLRGRFDQARDVLKQITGQEDVEDELEDMKRAVAESTTARGDDGGSVLGKMLTTPHVRRALFAGAGLQFFQQLCGINTVIYYSASILKLAGFPVKYAIWLVMVPNTINFLSTFIGLYLVERLGRKLLTIISLAGVALALAVLAIGFQLSYVYSPELNTTLVEFYGNGSAIMDCNSYSYTTCEQCIEHKDCGFCYDELSRATCLPAKDDVLAEDGRCGAVGNSTEVASGFHWSQGYCPTDYTWMAVLGLAFFVFAFAPGLGPMPWTINSEIYPLWARSTGTSIATAVNWILNLIISFTFLTLTETITKHGTFWLYGSFCVLGIIFVFIFVPETKNLSLEEVELMFMTKKERASKDFKEKSANGFVMEINVPQPEVENSDINIISPASTYNNADPTSTNYYSTPTGSSTKL
ncbi:proton myo-inositol cotransporter [Patella vulgata]|uniref:proton myo-inositol cotransporter n=1 Tax=Patella vulgata TaxID=6465 RepID=UPI00217F60C4|nr:proton myo-inositol cotransporter [Patella vulgata]